MVDLPMASVNAAVTDHFIMLFWDMSDETLYEFHNRDSFFHILVIFVAVVVESNKITIILIDPGSSDHGTAEVSSDIFYNCFGITFVRLGIDVETILVIPVTAGLDLFERGADLGFHIIEQSGAERVTQESVIKMIDIAPEAIITVATFRDETMDVRIPFEIPAEGMEDHDKTGSKIHGFVLLEKHAGNNAVYGMEKAVKEGTVIEKKVTELFINGKDTMTVCNIDELKGHRGSTLHGV